MAQSVADALNSLSKLKSKAKRTEDCINQSLTWYEDQKPDYNYKEEVAVRADLEDQITRLKAHIQVTNATTKVTYKGKYLPISYLILLNAQLRTDLAFWAGLLVQSQTYSIYSRRTRDDLKTITAEGFSKSEIRKTVEKLEAEKEELESFLNLTNLKTTLIED